MNHIELSKRALKDLRRIDHANRRRLLNLLEQDLAAEPQPPNLDVKPLVGRAPWQRRVSLSVLRLAGHLPGDLWRLLSIEAAVVLTTGCAAGTAAGVIGHALLGRWLALTTGYPAPFAIGETQALRLMGIVLAGALVLIGCAGTLASGTPPRNPAHQPT